MFSAEPGSSAGQQYPVAMCHPQPHYETLRAELHVCTHTHTHARTVLGVMGSLWFSSLPLHPQQSPPWYSTQGAPFGAAVPKGSTVGGVGGVCFPWGHSRGRAECQCLGFSF